MYISNVLLSMSFSGEASVTLSATEPPLCKRTVELRDSLWIMGFHMAIEIVGAGGGIRTALEEARTSRGLVSEGLCIGKRFDIERGKG